jgi:hypothetical protein
MRNLKNGRNIMTMLTVIANKWFEKVNGNTYHSCEVYINNKLIKRAPFVYGYGSQYEQTALEILHEAGIATEFDILWKYRESIGRDNCLTVVSDVSRKKDL